nr:PREDICTED: regulator of G-protein signaling 16-like [Apteryx mantelli mantelli]
MQSAAFAGRRQEAGSVPEESGHTAGRAFGRGLATRDAFCVPKQRLIVQAIGLELQEADSLSLEAKPSLQVLSHTPQHLPSRSQPRDGVTAFHTFLKTEFSEENLDFWLACEDFKKTRSKTKLASKANRIFEEFVQSEAPREVNIDHETREITRKNLSGATSACFNEAQAKTRTLMEKDSYPRFLKSASYQDMTKQATSRCISKRSHT